MTSILTAGHLLTPSRVCADPWAIETSLAVTEKYDDNIGMTEANETGDFVTTLLPGVRVYRVSDRLTVSASYHANMEMYTNHHDANGISHLALAETTMTGFGGGRLEKAQLRISDAYTDTERLADYPAQGAVIGNGGVITPPTPTIRNSLSAIFSMPLTDTLRGEAGYTRSFTRYDQSDLIDSSSQEVTASLTDQFTPRITMGLSYTFSISNFDIPAGSTTSQNSENPASHAGDLSMAVIVSPTVNVGLRVGEVYFSDSSEIQTTGSASINKRFQYADTLISYTRTFSSGSGIYSQPSIDDSVTAAISRAMGEHAHAALTGSYDSSRATGSGHGHAHSFGVAASVNYNIARWLLASAIYRHTAQQAVLDSIDVNTQLPATMNVRDNTVTVMLTGTWEWGTPAPAAQPPAQEQGANP
ncbi:MAG: hypothetical protein HY208_07810 [Nitrospirae bacterium]|nr:hypothetical protein [Nitrospirota bacterium]